MGKFVITKVHGFSTFRFVRIGFKQFGIMTTIILRTDDYFAECITNSYHISVGYPYKSYFLKYLYTDGWRTMHYTFTRTLFIIMK